MSTREMQALLAAVRGAGPGFEPMERVPTNNLLEKTGDPPYNIVDFTMEKRKMTLANSHTAGKRSERLEARITPMQKSLFKKAAELEGRTLSDFIVQAASEAALRTVQAYQAIRLTAEEQEAFVETLLDPPAPGSRLREAASRYKKTME